MSVGIDAFNNCQNKHLLRQKFMLFLLYCLLYGLHRLTTDNNKMNANSSKGLQLLLSQHFRGAALEILLLVSQSLEKYSSNIPSNILNEIQYRCWYLIDLCMKSINDSVAGSRSSKRSMKSIDFQLILPYILVAMRSSSKEVRKKAYNILMSRFILVGESVKYGEDNGLQSQDILIFRLQRTRR